MEDRVQCSATMLQRFLSTHLPAVCQFEAPLALGLSVQLNIEPAASRIEGDRIVLPVQPARLPRLDLFLSRPTVEDDCLWLAYELRSSGRLELPLTSVMAAILKLFRARLPRLEVDAGRLGLRYREMLPEPWRWLRLTEMTIDDGVAIRLAPADPAVE